VTEHTHTGCIPCVVKKAHELADRYILDSRKRYRFIQRVLAEIAAVEYGRTAPYMVARVMRLLKEETGVADAYREEKQECNRRMLAMQPQIEDILYNAEDRLKAALQIALAGNIIDFGPMRDVPFAMINDVIEQTLHADFDMACYARLRSSLGNAGHLLYLGDNAGETVFDKVLIKEIKREYPGVAVTFAARGEPVLNDATVQDALDAGLGEYATVIGNGADLPGTDLSEVSGAFLEVFDSADVIISKGQGNFESLPGCGRNVFYLFLCKCDLLMHKLQKDKWAHIFIHESDL
jgi:uncharacterized protein with ATP-grasp and redox domains